MLEPLNSALTEALQDEYKARTTYRLILDKFGEIAPFRNIVEAEERHIQALLPLFQKYGIPIPADEWEAKIQVPDSISVACELGVQAEIENAELYQRLLQLTQKYPDVQRVFLNLQRASQANHLPAFQRCVDFSAVAVEPNPEPGRTFQSQTQKGNRLSQGLSRFLHWRELKVGIRCRVSGFRYQVSGVSWRIRHPLPSTRYPAPIKPLTDRNLDGYLPEKEQVSPQPVWRKLAVV
jgi:rubrerythrin